jgi:hypothetical protein
MIHFLVPCGVEKRHALPGSALAKCVQQRRMSTEINEL